MKASELINELQNLIKKHGDLDVKVNHQYTEHYCGPDSDCYCSLDNHILDVYQPSFVADVREFEYSERQKLKDPKQPAIVIGVER
jgi:hypothetical protein